MQRVQLGIKWMLLMFVFITLMTFHASAEQADDKTLDGNYELEEIIVKGRMVRGLEKKLHEEPATVHSISTDEIENMDVKRTLDLIRRIPGVTAENYNQQGVAAAYSFRGYRLGHGVGAASYLDGIPYNEINHVDGDGYPDYNTILPESIDRLEVMKGLSSPLYGAYAQAGTLHYITKEKGDYTKSKLSAGSWNYYRGVAEIARDKGPFFTYNAVSAEQGDGYRDHSDWHGGNLFSRFGYNMTDDSTIRLTVHSYKTEWNAPGSLTKADWDAGNLTKAVTDGGGNKEKNMLSLDYSLKLNKDSDITLLGYGYNSDFTRWVGGANEERHDERNTFGGRFMYNLSSNFAGFANDLVLGIDYEHSDSEARKWNIQSPDTRIRASEKLSGDFNFQNTSLYIQNNFWLTSYLKLMGGLRYENFDGDLKNNLTNIDSSYSESALNPKGGILVTPFEGLELFGNVGKGFVLPSGFKKFETGNLDPSDILSYDIGARYLPAPEVLLQLSLFRADTKNEVITDPITLEETNAGETRRQGIEAGIEWFILPELSFYTNLAYQDAEYKDYNTAGGNYSGNDINRVPEWIAKAGLEYFPELGLGGSLSASYTGERWSDAANTAREPDYMIIDASVRYAFSKTTFTLHFNNLFDKKYAELQNINSFSPADPFNVTLSCSISF
jgi:iron complex outermembrane recepter protein